MQPVCLSYNFLNVLIFYLIQLPSYQLGNYKTTRNKLTYKIKILNKLYFLFFNNYFLEVD